MKITIEKNIPAPVRGQRAFGLTATMRAMEVGDSFLVATDAERLSVCSTARYAGIKVASRKVDGGFRIWRLS